MVWSQNQEDEITSLIEKGDKYRRILPDSAMFFYRTALEQAYIIHLNDTTQKNPAVRETNGKHIIKAETQLGHIYYFDCKYGLAMDHYNKALTVAQSIDDTFEIAETLFNIGEIFLEKNDYPTALDYYDSALNIYQKINSSYGAFWCYLSQGIILKNSGKFQESLETYKKAQDIARQRNDERGVADCYNNMGNVLKQQGKWAQAADYFDHALKIFRKLGEEMRISDCLNNIGDIYYMTGQHFTALKKYMESLRIVKLAGDPYRQIMRNNNIAETLVSLGRYDEALEYFNAAMALAEEANDQLQLAECFTNLGQYFMTGGDSLQATAYFQKALKMATETGNVNVEISINNMLASCFTGQGKYILAMDHALNAHKLALRTGAKHEIMNALFNQYKIYEALGNDGKALAAYQEFVMMKDSMASAQQKTKLEAMEFRETTDLLNSEVAFLEDEKANLEGYIQDKRFVFFFILGMAVLLIAAISILLFKYLRLRSASLLLKARDENDALKKEIDIKDRELAAKSLIIQQKNELLNQTTSELESHKDHGDEAWLKNVINRIRIENNPEQWKEFENYFNKANPEFLKTLSDKYPELTPGERRICTFLRLDMNTREISIITGQSLKSIEVTRTRIRKKLKLSRNENLTNFINRI